LLKAWAIRGRTGQQRMVRRKAECWIPMLQAILFHPAAELRPDLTWKVGGRRTPTLAVTRQDNLPWQPYRLRVRTGLGR
jgi:hypothetical protein